MRELAPIVSVIIPCFNHGQFLAEAVESVQAQTAQDFEIIVINDGSTDPLTAQVLKTLSYPKTTIIHSENIGVSAARNLGIKNARGSYILPLDADDKIGPTYLEQAIAILQARPEIGIVFCEAEFFGNKTGKWHLPPFKMPDMLLFPRIFCSSVFRKADWEQVGGFSTDMKYGWEDFEFWLSLIEKGCGVHQIPETLFFYRQSGSGMTKSLTREKLIYSYERLFARHQKLYCDNIGFLFASLLDGSAIRQDAGRGASFQVFFPNAEYTERESSRRRYNSGQWTRLVFELADGCIGQRTLRLDPVEYPAMVDIAAVRIKSSTGQIVWSAKSAKELKQINVKGSAKRIAHERLLRILSTGNDPQLHMPKLRGAQFAQPLKLEVWIRLETDLAAVIKVCDKIDKRFSLSFFSF